MPLTHLAGAGGCANGVDCPTVYDRGDANVVVRGYTDGADDGLQLPAGEGAVVIPHDVLLAAADALRGRR